MPLSSKKQLGRLELLAELALGGPSEFFRARDTRTGEEVGVQILPLRHGTPFRFEQQHHRITRLRHPHILAVRGLRAKADISYLITDPIEGSSLSRLLKRGPLATPEAVGIARQIAEALGAAHAAGVIHGDLNPCNVLVDSKADIKVLGFSQTNTSPDSTEYLSPEQVRHEPTDARTDIFSLGRLFLKVVAFDHPDTPAVPIEPELAAIIDRCLQTDPSARYQSAADLSLALGSLVQQSLTATEVEAPASERSAPASSQALRTALERGWHILQTAMARLRRVRMRGAAILLSTLAVLLAADVLVRSKIGAPQAPTFQRLTFQQGPLLRARFGPQAKSIVYTARFEGMPQTTYVLDPVTMESRSLDLPPGSSVLAVSSKDDLLIRLADGILARRPLAGGPLINEAMGLLDADWSPNGAELAVTRFNSGRNDYVLEFPIGHVLFEGNSPIELVRVSPKGDHVAYAIGLGSEKQLWVTSRSNSKDKRMLASLALGEANRSLAWSPDGKEIWFGASNADQRGIIQAAGLDGRKHTIDWMPESLLDDVGPNGQALVEMFRGWNGIRVRSAGQSRDTDVSWFGESVNANRSSDGRRISLNMNIDLSRDGRRIFFTEHGSSDGAEPAVYLRSSGAAAPVRLADGSLVAVSPDAEWASVYRATPTPAYVLVPASGGKERPVEIPSLENRTAAVLAWLTDGRYLIWGNQPNYDKRHFLWTPSSKKLTPITPEGSSIGIVSGDGARLIVTAPNHTWYVFPVSGGEHFQAQGIRPADQLLRWTQDGTSLFVGASGSIYKVNVTTGVRTPWKLIEPDFPHDSMLPAAITPDGETYAYLYFRGQSELFLARGMK